MPHPTTEPEVDKTKLRSFTCAECGEVRNLLDFYDDEHEVYWTKDMSIYIDHGAGKKALAERPRP